MKVLVVIVGLLFVGWQIDARAIASSSVELDADDEACIAELHLNRDKIEAAAVSRIFPENDQDFDNFMGCSSKRHGMTSPNGDVNYDRMTEEMLDAARKDPDFPLGLFKLYKEMITASIDQCHQHPASGANPGHTLIKTRNCMVRKLEEMTED